jgi:hypothetical protein
MLLDVSPWQLAFCDQSGALLSCRFNDVEIASSASLELAFETPAECRFVSQELCSQEDSSAMRQEYLLCAKNTYRIFQEWHAHRDGHLERTLFLDYKNGDNKELLKAATLSTAGLMLGEVERTRVSLPMARGLSSRPLRELLSRQRELPLGGNKNPDGGHFGLQSAPDIFPGAICLKNADAPLHLSILPLPHECPVAIKLWGDGENLHLEQRFGCEIYPDASTRYELARQIWLLENADWKSALPAAGKLLSKRGYSVPEQRPAWAKSATILEVEIGFMGGLKKLREQLEELQRIGFNTVYLMPWHIGKHSGYATGDYLQINPDYGTFDDLRALCDAAHERGMKVLFDMLVNIAGDDSEYPQKHPDWFYHDENGNPLRHPTWGGACLDPASPGFRQFLVDYAVRCCTQWGADGFRVDAVAHRGGNLHPLPGLQPHQHSQAVFSLVGEIRSAIRNVKPDAILLAECFGPAQVPVSDLVCTSWIAWLDWALDRVLNGRLNGEQVARLLHEQFAAMPPGTWFTGYTHTHDTVAFEGRDLQGPPVDALFAAMSLLCAGAMVFGGGWNMRPRPGDEEKPYYRRLFQMREKLGGVAGSDVQFEYGENPALLMAKRPSNNGDVYVVANFSSQAQPLPFENQSEYSYLGQSAADEIAPFDVVVWRA